MSTVSQRARCQAEGCGQPSAGAINGLGCCLDSQHIDEVMKRAVGGTGEALRAFLRVEILYDFPKWQASALLEAGKCHERLGEWGEAVASYERLLDRYRDTPFAEEADERLAIAQKHTRNSTVKRRG